MSDVVAEPSLPPAYGNTVNLLPRASLRACLLVLLQEGTTHGYELLDQVRAMGLGKVDTAAVYRCLRAMDEEGLVHSRWEPSGSGPARRSYAVTEEGRQELATMVTELSGTVQALQALLTRCTPLASARDGAG